MNKFPSSKYLAAFAIVGIGFFIGYLIIVQAQTSNITYPVKELGNCNNETECRSFCDKPEHIVPCVTFAERNGLISDEEAAQAKKIAQIGSGPGGCKGRDACETYCEDTAHIEECLAFAEKNNMMSSAELQEARQIAKALKEGAQMPGGCTKKSDCETYCDEPEHMEECVAFAEKAGLIPAEELADAKKAAQAMKSGIKPPGNCKGKKQCDAYCSEPSNMEQCMQFALDAGFMSEQERPNAEKMLAALKRGVKPLPCKGKDACDAYCQEETHRDECVNFAVEAGFMKPEEAEMFKKTGGKGPGNCKDKEECENYCNNPANQETCFKFAQENGLIPQEDIQRMKEGMQKMQEGLQNAPSQVVDCLKSNLGTEVLEKMQAGTLTPGQQIGDQVKKCFEQFTPAGGPPPGAGSGTPGMPPSGNMMPPGGEFKGPGGCASPEECQKYCSEHQEECSNFGGPQNQQMPPQGTQPQGAPVPNQMPSGTPSQEMIQQMIRQGIQPSGGMIPPQGQLPPANMVPPTDTNQPPSPPPSAPPPPTSSNIFQIFLNFLQNVL